MEGRGELRSGSRVMPVNPPHVVVTVRDMRGGGICLPVLHPATRNIRDHREKTQRAPSMAWRPGPRFSLGLSSSDYDERDPWIQRFISKTDDGELSLDVNVSSYSPHTYRFTSFPRVVPHTGLVSQRQELKYAFWGGLYGCSRKLYPTHPQVSLVYIIAAAFTRG